MILIYPGQPGFTAAAGGFGVHGNIPAEKAAASPEKGGDLSYAFFPQVTRKFLGEYNDSTHKHPDSLAGPHPKEVRMFQMLDPA